MTENLDGMTPEELRAWYEQKREENRKEWAGVPLPPISRVKRDDYPHWEQVGWAFRLRDGSPAQVSRGDAKALEGVVRGLRPVADGGPSALIVEVDGTAWAVRRADGTPAWADSLDARRATVADLAVPVIAWHIGEHVGPTEVVPAPEGRSQSWTIRTNRLNEDDPTGQQ